MRDRATTAVAIAAVAIAIVAGDSADRAKYQAIGGSDRFTLRFVKQ
jgi:hypothetical protein